MASSFAPARVERSSFGGQHGGAGWLNGWDWLLAAPALRPSLRRHGVVAGDAV
jgi:hypothetical protein